ncbi:MAG: sigma factor-like helix-turn-helix DNA-binding protein [Acidobacteriota bacterium]|nr:sigma factor-like helix-turn-helix DNA-binding protein [Acidobacteriota bacterium]
MKDEAALVDKALGGDESAFEQLLHPYRNGMLNIAYQMTGNTEEARDICQTARVMGSSSQSVRTHLCRARRKLRLEFEKIYPKGRWSNEV